MEGNGKPKKFLPNPKCKKVGENKLADKLADKEKKDELLFVFTGKEMMSQPQSGSKLNSKPAADVEPAPRKNLLANQTSATSLWMNSASSPKGKTKKQCGNTNSNSTAGDSSTYQQTRREPGLVPVPVPAFRPQLEEMTPIPLPHRQTQSESSWFSRFLDEEQKEKKRTEMFRAELESKQMAEKNRARPPGRVCLPPKPMDYPPEDDYYGRNNYNCGDGIQPNIATFPSQEKMQFGDHHLYNSNGINRQIQYHQHQHQHMNTLKSSKSTARIPSEFYANVATISLDSNSNPTIRAPRIGPGPQGPVVERRPKMLVGAYDEQNYSTMVQTDSAIIKNARNNLSRSEDLNESKGLVQSLYLKELQEQILMKRKETEERKQREKDEEERIERKIKQDLEKMQNEYLQELQTRKERPLKHSLDIEKKLFEYDTKALPAPSKMIQENKVYSRASGYVAKKADAKPPVPPYSFISRFLPPPVPKNVSAQTPENSGPKTDLMIKSLTSSITSPTAAATTTMTMTTTTVSKEKEKEKESSKKKGASKSKKNSPRCSGKILLIPMPSTKNATKSDTKNETKSDAKSDEGLKDEFFTGFKMALEKEIRRVEQVLNLESSTKKDENYTF